MSKNVVETEEPQMTSQYGAYALHAGVARLHALMRMHTPRRPGTYMHARTSVHIQPNMQYLLLLHSNNGFVNAPQYYVIRTLPVLFTFVFPFAKFGDMNARVVRNPTWTSGGKSCLTFLSYSL
jgi:hypothetical protein